MLRTAAAGIGIMSLILFLFPYLGMLYVGGETCQPRPTLAPIWGVECQRAGPALTAGLLLPVLVAVGTGVVRRRPRLAVGVFTGAALLGGGLGLVLIFATTFPAPLLWTLPAGLSALLTGLSLRPGGAPAGPQSPTKRR